MSTLDEFKYVVGLAPGKTSFYDPVSKCNLFLTRKVFGFNIEPTTNILTALKHGTLVDVKGNLKETDTVRLAPDQMAQIQAAVQPPPVDPPPIVPPPADAPKGRAKSKAAAQPPAGEN